MCKQVGSDIEREWPYECAFTMKIWTTESLDALKLNKLRRKQITNLLEQYSNRSLKFCFKD